jgi:hypothetical protein
MAERHTILGGKVYIYKRPNSSRWQCSSYFAGKNRRTSTKEESLAKAEPSGLCVDDCSFALVYDVPTVFGEGSFKLDFDANKKVLRKRWYD